METLKCLYYWEYWDRREKCYGIINKLNELLYSPMQHPVVLFDAGDIISCNVSTPDLLGGVCHKVGAIYPSKQTTSCGGFVWRSCQIIYNYGEGAVSIWGRIHIYYVSRPCYCYWRVETIVRSPRNVTSRPPGAFETVKAKRLPSSSVKIRFRFWSTRLDGALPVWRRGVAYWLF